MRQIQKAIRISVILLVLFSILAQILTSPEWIIEILDIVPFSKIMYKIISMTLDVSYKFAGVYESQYDPVLAYIDETGILNMKDIITDAVTVFFACFIETPIEYILSTPILNNNQTDYRKKKPV